MTRSGAPFQGAYGEGRSAISPATSQAAAEPCARAFSAARAKRNAPVINDNAVVAAPTNWRAENMAIPCLCFARRHNWLKTMAKVDRPSKFRPPGMRVPPDPGGSLLRWRVNRARRSRVNGTGVAPPQHSQFFLQE